MARLMIQRRGAAPEPLDVAAAAAARATVAGEALVVHARAPDGVVVELRRPARAGGRALEPGLRRLLRADDRLEIDDCMLWLEPDPEDERTRALAGAILSGSAAPPIGGPTLLVVEGPSAGTRLPVSHNAVLGRGGGAELLLEDPLASRRHLRLLLRRRAIVAEDLASKNGLAARGRRRCRVRLRQGDTFTVGGSVLVVLRGPGGDRQRVRSGTAAPRRQVALAALASGLLVAAALALAAAAGS